MDEVIQYDGLVAEHTEPKATMMESYDAHVNRNAKDSVFCNLFARPEYCLQLYQALHPEDRDVKTEDIVLVTLQNMMTLGRYNDLGILVRNRLLVLVEAQSVFTENILIRFLMYLGDTYSRFVNKEKLNIYGTKKVILPVPELYVIYHGERGDKPDEITLSKDVFGIESAENIFVNVKAKIIYGSTPGDIIDQFITFCRVFDRQIREHGRTHEAVEETLRICKDENVLREYLADEEAATFMFKLLDQQKAMKYWEEEIRQESEAKKCTENIRSLMVTLKFTAQQAMDALQIPPQEQEKYAKLL